MREYFPKSSEIPKDVYKQVVAILSGYERLKRERQEILYGTPQKLESGRSNEAGRPAEQKAIKLTYIDERLRAVDQACVWMRGKLDGKAGYEFNPLEAFYDYNYYNAQYIRHGPKDNGPAPRTWRRYKRRFASLVAKNLKLF